MVWLQAIVAISKGSDCSTATSRAETEACDALSLDWFNVGGMGELDGGD